MKIFTIALLAFSLNAYAQAPIFLNANATAQPDNVCAGTGVQLSATATGGTENYTYSWTSTPEGFTSSLREPFVTPLITTLYEVEVSDGTSIVTGSVTVTVKETPVISLIPVNTSGIEVISSTEIAVCPFNSVTLDAGNPGSVYLWSNGSTQQKVTAETSGISFDLQEYEVTVTDPGTGCFSSSTMLVNFDFSYCTYGMEEKTPDQQITIFPNPSNTGVFSFDYAKLNGDINVSIYTTTGIPVQDFSISNKSGRQNEVIDLSHLAAGMYLVKIDNYGNTILKKIVIQR